MIAESSTQRLTYHPMQVEERADNVEDDYARGSANGDEEDHTDQAHTAQRAVRNPDSWKKKHIKRKGFNSDKMHVG